jgi:hypothetical protein
MAADDQGITADLIDLGSEAKSAPAFAPSLVQRHLGFREARLGWRITNL